MNRKKIAQLVLLAAVIVIGSRFAGSCDHAPVSVEIHYLLGDPPVAAGLEVTVEPAGGGPAVDHFETTLISPDVKQATRLPGGDSTLDITLIGKSGARHTVRRDITAERGAVIRIDLSREAREAPAE